MTTTTRDAVRDLVEDAFEAGWAQHAGRQTREYPGLDAITDRIVALLRQPVEVPSFGDVEDAAQRIYNTMRVFDAEGAKTPWQEGGNSIAQDAARDLARNQLMRPASQPTPEAQAVEVLVKAGWVETVVRGSLGDFAYVAKSSDEETRKSATSYGVACHRALIAPTREN